MAEEKVLVVDDDPSIQRLLKKILMSNQLTCDIAGSGAEALNLASNNLYSVILLDITMDGMDGFEVIEVLRSRGITTPIIVVSGKSEDFDQLYGLELGADDYITKPFNPVVLGAKVKAVIRRNSRSASGSVSMLTRGPFVFNKSTLHLSKNGTDIPLSSKETQLMAFFMDHPGQVFSKSQLYQQVWNEIIPDENTVTVHINHLRAKLEDNPKAPRYIVTVWGLGYKFVAE